MTKNPTNQLVNRHEAAQFLGVAENTLAVWATNKRYNLPYVKIGRCVRYKLSDLNAFIEKRTLSGGI